MDLHFVDPRAFRPAQNRYDYQNCRNEGSRNKRRDGSGYSFCSNAIITIADNGAGVPESMRRTLFDAFKSDKSKGNGLGLWIVREIVHNHGGKIQYRSNSVSGRSGTIFRLSLPVNP